MNSRFIDIVALLDDASFGDVPVVIDSCSYYVECADCSPIPSLQTLSLQASAVHSLTLVHTPWPCDSGN